MPRTLTFLSLWLAATSALAMTADEAPVLSEEQSLAAVDALADELEETVALGEESEQEISIDAGGSMADAEEEVRRTWTIRADARAAGTYSDLQPREGEPDTETDFLGRARLGISRALGTSWRVGGRLAASCTSENCRPDNFFEEETQGSSDNGVSVDEAFVHWLPNDRFNIVAGRMQTKFITKGGVFAKSMDRNDSNNTRVTWTDGLHGTLNFENGWEPHLILQYNREEGPAQITREPLDFEDDDARVSGFLTLLNEKPWRFLTQRAFNLNYYPAALKKDGLIDDSRIEDYWGFTAKVAGRYPKRSSGRRLRFSLEAAYAPETPTKAGIGLAGTGDTDGLAAAATLAWMDFFPNHSIGLNLAHTGGGWLLSPQYNKNERLAEIRYVWVALPSLTVDVRLRYRQELDQLVTAERKREEVDAFARLTWRLTREQRVWIN